MRLTSGLIVCLYCNLKTTEYLAEDGVFYIVSPKDVVVARQRDKDDHIDWLIENDKFEVSIWKCDTLHMLCSCSVCEKDI